MTDPVLFASNLDAEAIEVATTWSELCHDIVLEEGRRLDLYGAGLPILVGVICEMRPGISGDERVALAEEIHQASIAGMKLWYAEPAGEA